MDGHTENVRNYFMQLKNKKTEKNQRVITENEKADCFYIVFEGEFEIIKQCVISHKDRNSSK